MKKTFLTLVGIMLCSTLLAQQGDLKRHNFGLSLDFGSFPMGNDYFEVVNRGVTELKSAVAFDIALKYEYMLNKKNTFSLTAEPGYANHVLTIYNSISSINDRQSVHALNLPVLVNYRLPITENVNFIGATGLNASLYLTDKVELRNVETPIPEYNTVITTTENISFKNPLTLDFALKAGIEIATKHRFQFNVSYYLPILGNTNMEYLINGVDYGLSNRSDKGINRLMFGISLFL